jgi:hypothetical protein
MPPLKKTLLIACSLAGAGCALWAACAWHRYPKVPDVSAANVNDALAFVAGDDFNRMFQWHRRRFALATVDKLRQRSFDELVWMLLDPGNKEQRTRIARNIRMLSDHEDIHNKVLAIFLDKFYELPKFKQTTYLTTFALAQRVEMARHPQDFGLPDSDQFKQDMARFISKQPPRVQAQFGQFLLDLKRHRQFLGLKDPFYPRKDTNPKWGINAPAE